MGSQECSIICGYTVERQKPRPPVQTACIIKNLHMSNLGYLFPQKFIKPCLVSPHISGIHSTKSDFFFFCRMIAKGSNIRLIQMSSFQSIIQRNKDYNSNYKVLFFSILDHINNCYYLHFYFLKSRGNTESPQVLIVFYAFA